MKFVRWKNSNPITRKHAPVLSHFLFHCDNKNNSIFRVKDENPEMAICGWNPWKSLMPHYFSTLQTILFSVSNERMGPQIIMQIIPVEIMCTRCNRRCVTSMLAFTRKQFPPDPCTTGSKPHITSGARFAQWPVFNRIEPSLAHLCDSLLLDTVAFLTDAVSLCL